jgi:hypothetical protein
MTALRANVAVRAGLARGRADTPAYSSACTANDFHES